MKAVVAAVRSTIPAARVAAAASAFGLAMAAGAPLVVMATGRVVPAPVPGPQQSGPTTPTVSVLLYHSQADWYGEPGTPVCGTATNDGVVVASAYRATADRTGHARLTFSRPSSYRGPARRGTLLPGDQLVILAAGHAPLTVTLRAVAADLDAAGDRIGGKAPPGSRTRVVLRDAAGALRLDREVIVDPAGRFLVAATGADLLPTDSGEVVLTDPVGNQIRSLIAAPRVQIEIGRPVGCVNLRDESHNVELRAADGRIKYSGCEQSRSQAVEAGDLVTLQLGPGFLVPGVPPTSSFLVPALGASFDVGAATLRGHGPGGQRLDIELGNAFGWARHHTVVTDAQGRFGLPMAGAPATFATVRLDTGGSFTVAQTFGLTTLLVGLGNAVVAGLGGTVADPVDARLVLMDGAGAVKAEQYLTSGPVGVSEVPWVGDWSALAESLGGVSAQPGDGLEVQIGDGDPVAMTVPDITAEVDAVSDVIAGEAPPGAEMTITFADASLAESAHPPAQTVADAHGRYRADLGSAVDIEPGMWGLVAVWSAASPVAIYTVWYAQQLQIDLTTGLIQGIGALSETYEVQLYDPSGQLKLTAEDTVPGALSFYNPRFRRRDWATYLWRDMFDHLADVRPGATVAVRGRHERTVVTIPDMELRADPATDQIAGHVPSDHHLEVRITPRELGDPTRLEATLETEARVGADGGFLLALAGRFDLRAGDIIEARAVGPAGHVFEKHITVPVFDVDLDNGWITGRLEQPAIDVPVTATLQRSGAVIARTAGLSDFWSYSVPLRDASGAPAVPMGGDRVAVEVGTTPPSLLALTIPDLAVTMDWQGEHLHGRMSTPGVIELHTTGQHFVYPRPGPDGVFDVPIQRPGAAQPWAFPGNGGSLRIYLPGGHIVERSFLFPRLDLELGGARIEAQVTEMTRVDAQLLDVEGNLIARGAAQAGERSGGYAVLVMADERGPVRLQSGQRVRATAGDASLETTIPELTVSVDWAGQALAGSGPAGSLFQQASETDSGCRVETGFSWEHTSSRSWNSYAPLRQDSTGSFSIAGFFIAPGTRFMVSYVAPDGHRVVRTVERPSAIIDVAGGTVRGCSQPLEPVSVELLDEDSARRALGTAVADAAGAFRAELRSTQGSSVALHPTDRLRVCGNGDCADVAADHVAVALEGAAAIVGRVSPGLPAYLELTPRYPFASRPDYPQLEGGGKRYWYPYTFEVSADSAGDLRLTNDDLQPPYRPWGIADLERVRVWSEVDDGHYLVAVAAARTPVFLPTAQASRR